MYLGIVKQNDSWILSNSSQLVKNKPMNETMVNTSCRDNILTIWLNSENL